MNRIVRGIGANALGQFVTTLTQLLNVPLFLATWGPERYGVWLMLNTIPVYLGLSDLGFTGVAANRINMMIAAGNQKRALACFQSTLALLLVLGTIITAIAVALGAAMGASIETWTGMSRAESVLAMLMIAIQVFGYTLALLSHGVFCSSGRYAEGTLWFNLSRLLEFALLAMGVLLLKGGFLLLLTLLAGSRVLLVLVLYLRMRTFAPWATIGLGAGSRQEIRELMVPALTSLAFPIGNAMNVQGITLCAGFVLGPAYVAYFSAMRTLSRIPYQLGQLISQALAPEIGRLYGERNAMALRALYRHALFGSVLLASATALTLYLIGDWICNYWTHGKIVPLHPDYSWLLLAAVANSLWVTASAMVTATNNHAGLAGVYMGANIAGLLVAALGGSLIGGSAVSLGVLATEVLVLFALLPQIQAFARHGLAGVLARHGSLEALKP